MIIKIEIVENSCSIFLNVYSVFILCRLLEVSPLGESEIP